MNGEFEYKLLYSGQLSPVARLDENDRVVEQYVYATRVNVPDYMIKDGRNYSILTDHRGSVRMVVDASSGEIVQETEYSEFGEITDETLAQGWEPVIFGYAGGLQDRHTGLIRFGARDYDPETGRWTSKEPLGFNGSNNFYAYVDGDPVNFVDVTGLDAVILIGGPYGSHSYGHVALRVYGNGYDYTYDFGRYGKKWGTGDSEGEGVLRIWASFDKYIKGENATGRSTTGYIFNTTQDQDKKMMLYYENLVSGKGHLSRYNGKMQQYVLSNDYHWGNNNCTTITLGAFSASTNIVFEKDATGRGMGFMEKAAAKISGWPDRTFMPLDLKYILDKRNDVSISNWP